MANLLRLSRQIFEVLKVLTEIRDFLRSIHVQLKEMSDFQTSLKPASEPERLLRAKEIASLLKVDTKTIWNWKKKGSLVPVTIGSHDFYPESLIRRLKKEC